MRIRRVQWYVAAMVVAAAACIVFQDWEAVGSLPVTAFAVLLLLGILSESVALRVTVAKSTGYSTITYIPFFSSVLLFGPEAGVLLAACIMSVGEFLLRSKPIERSIFNVAQWILNSTVSGWIYTALYSALIIESGGMTGSLGDGSILLPFGGFVLSFFTINYFAVATAIALDRDEPLYRVLQNVMGSAGANLLYGVAFSPLTFVVVVLYEHLHALGILLSLLPLIFIRHSYATNIKLQKANSDLLTALIKAIETRDPYTSGHSLRVSALAEKIARNLGLSQARVAHIAQAALLHDIGKIDAIYTDILRKPGSLSREERGVIESHVTKGVELLRSLSSLPPSVIDAVRHHHEREDGLGYPDGLSGPDIPIGAKIIKVCDAVDAMLSDRPYRKALSLQQVHEQLEEYAGSQFDGAIVRRVVESEILKEHRREVMASQSGPTEAREAAEATAGTSGAGRAIRRRLRTMVGGPQAVEPR